MELTVEDRLALHELPGVYGDAIDDRNWEALDRVFTEDAVFEVIGLVRMTGLAEIKLTWTRKGSIHWLIS
ncbi:MAG: nuclear transport factor 2 family protein [Gammaproteobacteria bacterium]|nr:nuclear transport factor 2 family protein [Gammaproteobacteria bacterium]